MADVYLSSTTQKGHSNITRGTSTGDEESEAIQPKSPHLDMPETESLSPALMAVIETPTSNDKRSHDAEDMKTSEYSAREICDECDTRFVEIQYQRFPMPPRADMPIKTDILDSEYAILFDSWRWSDPDDGGESDHTISPYDSSGSSQTNNTWAEKLRRPRKTISRWRLRRKRASLTEDLRLPVPPTFYQHAKSNMTRAYLRINSRSGTPTASDDTEDSSSSLEKGCSGTSTPSLRSHHSSDRRFGTWPLSRSKPRPRLMTVPGVDSRWDLLSSSTTSIAESSSEGTRNALETLEEEPKSRFSDCSDDDDVPTIIAKRLKPTWLLRNNRDSLGHP